MGSIQISRVTLYVLNIINAILGLAIIAASIWFFCQVREFTSLRNSNHYLLDYRVYWPQAIPWLFILVALFLVGVCSCGFTSAKKKSRSLLTMYIAALGIAAVVLVAAAVVSLVLADNKATDNFVKDTVWDVYSLSQTDPDVANEFGRIERKLHCCGADSPRDYKKWKDEFPQSCCDVFYHGWLDPYAIECEFSNKLANERHGCSTVAAQYTSIVIKVFSAAAIFTAFICIISLAVAVGLSKALARKRRRQPVQNESESKKVLL